MEIIFLGTGGGRINLINQTRATGGFIISGTQNIHVDPGPGALVHMRRMGLNPLKTNIILVTHSHIDHISDAGVLIEGMSNYGLRKAGILIGADDSLEGKTDGQRISEFHLSKAETIVNAKPGESFQFEGGKFTFTKAVHDTFPAFGFVLEMEGKRIGYTGDTEYFEGMDMLFEGCSLLILNVMKPYKDQYHGHLTAEDASKLIGRVQPKLAIITHIGMKMQSYPPEKKAKEIEEETGIKTIAATDGMKVSSDQF